MRASMGGEGGMTRMPARATLPNPLRAAYPVLGAAP